MGRIKLLVMDVDGTLTDGRIYMGQNGELMKAFDVKDGYGIANILPELGIIPVIITGRRSGIVEQRARELRITELYQGVSDKLAQLRRVGEKYDAGPGEIAYMGDDLNDLACIRSCGLSACPGDAAEEVRQAVDYVSSCGGGRGAVRDFIDRMLKGTGTEEESLWKGSGRASHS